MSSKPSAVFPDADVRWKTRLIDAPHPAVLAPESLLAGCDLRTQRRSGPGGQHRNKTSSGVFLTHRESGLIGEATERRSQAQNRDVALQRLRFIFALELRTPSPLDKVLYRGCSAEETFRSRYTKHNLRLADHNPDKPALLALLANDLWVAGGQPSLVAVPWKVSTSKLVTFIKSHAAALAWVNRIREHHAKLPLH